MQVSRRLLSFMPLAVLLMSCAGQEQATAAFNEAEAAITEQHLGAIRYAPDEFRAVMAAYDSAKTHYYAGDYRAAVKGARKTQEMARQLTGAITAGREAAKGQWERMREEVAAMLSTFEEKVDQLARSRRLPGGVDRADVTAAQKKLPELKTTFEQATSEFEQGNIAEALHAGSQVRAEARRLMTPLGLISAHEAN
jgi:hypothetical protein